MATLLVTEEPLRHPHRRSPAPRQSLNTERFTSRVVHRTRQQQHRAGAAERPICAPDIGTSRMLRQSPQRAFEDARLRMLAPSGQGVRDRRFEDAPAVAGPRYRRGVLGYRRWTVRHIEDEAEVVEPRIVGVAFSDSRRASGGRGVRSIEDATESPRTGRVIGRIRVCAERSVSRLSTMQWKKLTIGSVSVAWSETIGPEDGDDGHRVDDLSGEVELPPFAGHLP